MLSKSYVAIYSVLSTQHPINIATIVMASYRYCKREHLIVELVLVADFVRFPSYRGG